VFASLILRIKCDDKKSQFFPRPSDESLRKKGVFLQLARRTVNQANYNHNEILVLKILLPTHQEQREIADTIRVVDAKIRHHHTKEREARRSFPHFVAPVDDGSLGRTRIFVRPRSRKARRESKTSMRV